MHVQQTVVYSLFVAENRVTAGQVKGLDHSIVTVPSTTVTPHGLNKYCKDAVLNAEMAMLHERLLQEGDQTIQVEIDRRLHACIASDYGWQSRVDEAPVTEDRVPEARNKGSTTGTEIPSTTRSIPLHWLFTQMEDTMQYKCLPDIIRFISPTSHKATTSKMNTFKQGTFIEMLLNAALPCLCKGQHLQQNFSMFNANPRGGQENGQASSVKGKTSAPCRSEITVCLHILFGTLFALYPRCTKKPVFFVRKRLFHVMRSLLLASTEIQLAVLQQVPALLKLSFMEYIHNVLNDFCPSELAIISEFRGMDMFHQICATMCDSFRMDALQHQSESELTWAVLQERADVVVERIVRTCKMRGCKNTVTARACSMLGVGKTVNDSRKILQSWRKHSPQMQSPFLPGFDNSGKFNIMQAALDLPMTSCTSAMRITMKSYNMDPDASAGLSIAASIVQALQNNVSCFALPSNLMLMSCRALSLLRSNPQKVYCSSRVSFCMWCVCKSTASPLNCSLRLDVMSNKLCCAQCGDLQLPTSPPVLTINLTGRLLKVGSTYYYQCPFCVKIVQWESTGTEFSGNTCSHSLVCESRTPRVPKSARMCLARTSTVYPAAGGEGGMAQEHEDGSMVEQYVRSINNILAGKARVQCMEPVYAKHMSPTALGSAKFFTVTHAQGSGKKFTCLVCDRPGSCYAVQALHIPCARYVIAYLCSRHRLYDHLSSFLYDTKTFKQLLLARTESARLAAQ